MLDALDVPDAVVPDPEEDPLGADAVALALTPAEDACVVVLPTVPVGVLGVGVGSVVPHAAAAVSRSAATVARRADAFV